MPRRNRPTDSGLESMGRRWVADGPATVRIHCRGGPFLDPPGREFAYWNRALTCVLAAVNALASLLKLRNDCIAGFMIAVISAA